MKSNRFLTVLAAGAMLASLAACGSPTKYKVNYEAKPTEYTITGINSEGYTKDSTVSFAVTAASGKEITSVKYDTTTLTPVSENNYTFVMPEKDVTLTVTTQVLHNYTLDYSGTAKVDETCTFVLKDNDVIVTEDYTIAGKTAADEAFFTVDAEDATKLTFIKATGEGEKCTVVAKIGEDVKAEKELTIEKSDTVSIKEALDAGIKEAKFNGSAGKSGGQTTSTYKVGGEVVAVTKNKLTSDKGYSGTVLIDDGTEILPLMVYSTTTSYKDFGWAVGDSVTATVKLTNYYGVLEGIKTTSVKGTSSTSLYPDDITKTDKEYTTKSLETLDRAGFEAYYTTCVANSTVDETGVGPEAYTSVKFISSNVVGLGTVSENLLYNIPGTGTSSGNLNIIPFEGGQTINATKDVAYVTTGYLVGYNTGSGKNYGTYYAESEDDVAVTAWNFNDESVTGFVGLETDVEYTVTAPTGARGKVITASSGDEAICTYDGTKITGVAAGTTTITLNIDGVEHSLPVTISAEPHPCTGLTIDPTSISGFIGQEKTITATPTSEVSPCTDKVTYASSDANVATVDKDGKVTLVAEGSATITVTCGSFSQTCTVTVTGYGTVENPLSVKTALELAAYECATSGSVTKQVVTARGVVSTATDYSGTYIKQFSIKDETTEDTIIVYSANLPEEGIDKPDQNDTVIITGYVKNYSGTIEFASNSGTNVLVKATTRGTSTVSKGTEDGATISDLSTASGLNGTTFTFKVTAEAGSTVKSVTVNSVEVTAVDDVYTGTIHGNTVIDVLGLPEGAEKVVAIYSDTKTTTNMAKDVNNADKIGLDAEIFSVTAAINTGTSTYCGLNKNGYMALYCNKKSADGGSITISVDGTKFTINSIKVNWKQNSQYAKVTDAAGTELTETGGKYNVNSSAVSIQDVANQSSATQVHIYSITIVYTAISE